jgi:hypothetical protein
MLASVSHWVQEEDGTEEDPIPVIWVSLVLSLFFEMPSDSNLVPVIVSRNHVLGRTIERVTSMFFRDMKGEKDE